MDLKETLTKKVGPLPTYAWIGIGVGGVIVAKHFLKGGSNPLAASIAGTGNSADTGFGESAVPYDITPGNPPVYSDPPIYAPPLPIGDPGTPAGGILPGGDPHGPPWIVPPWFGGPPLPGTGKLPRESIAASRSLKSGRLCPPGYHLSLTPGPNLGRCVANLGADS